MITRKELKQRGKAKFKANYLKVALVCFLISFILGSASTANVIDTALQGFALQGIVNPLHHFQLGDTQLIDNIISHVAPGNIWEFLKNCGLKVAPKGFLGVLFNNVLQANSGIYGVLNSLDQLLFKNSLGASIIIMIGAVVSFLLWMFIINLIELGRYRFFLENHSYAKTPIKTVLMPFRVKAIWNQAFIMLTRAVFQLLWFLTIVGGFVKRYEYMMIPYIVAENPKISRKEAFALSKQMMMGHKWEAFVLDLSFLPWMALSIVTFNLLSIFFLYGYMDATATEYYLVLRKLHMEAKPEDEKLLGDAALYPLPDLAAPSLQEEYPKDKYPYPIYFEKALQINYERNYSFFSYIWMFFAVSIFGWVWEVTLYFFTLGKFINRGSTLGPWLPIYGYGTVLVIFFLRRFLKKPVLFVTLSTTVCAILEYAVSWYSETFQHVRYWDYTGYVLNLNGRICLESVATFAIATAAIGYIVAPKLDDIFLKMKKGLRQGICIVLMVLFVADMVYSHYYPNKDGVITDLESTAADESTAVETSEPETGAVSSNAKGNARGENAEEDAAKSAAS